ncbi:hypothetical protein [Peribacillus simplex]|uniref:hypothetical protein n=1 Tax=Peribacillus simplex TaxID=1478 RepID=UPI0015C32C32|nr:hypothetical protein [Peribacillus simplex]
MGYDVTFAGDAMGGWSIGVLLGALAFGVQTNIFKQDGRIISRPVSLEEGNN